MGHSRHMCAMHCWAEHQMTRKMVVPGREEILFNDLLDARRKRAVLRALKDEKARVAALQHIVPEVSELQDVDDLWDFLLLHTCQVTPAQKEHFTSVLRDASSFAQGSSFQNSEDTREPDWYSDVQTKAGYSSKVDMPVPDGSDCPQYTNREENQFQMVHKVHVYDKGCWSEWNMVRKPDDSRGQPNARAKLYTELMTARKASAAHQVQMAIDAMNAELNMIHTLPEQDRSACDFTDGQDVYRWVNAQAHQITAEQKRHLAAILQAAIDSLDRFGFSSPGSNWRDRVPTLQQHTAQGRQKYFYEFGRIWMTAMDQWL